LLSRLGIKAVVAAAGQSLSTLAAIKAASINKIPVIWGQHGGHYGYGEFPIINYLNTYYSHYFLYSEGCFSIAKNKKCFSIVDTKLSSIYRCKRYS